MQELKASLGLRLLDRTTRRLSPTEAGRRLHARLARLLSDPEVELDLGLSGATELRPGNCTDLVIRLGLPADKSVVGLPLASARRVPCASPAHLARRGAPAALEEVAAHDCLGDRRESEPLVWMFEARDGGQRAVEVFGLLRSNSGEALRQAALDGLGLVLPAWMVGCDVSAGHLVACVPRHRAYPAGYQAAIYAVHARGPAVPAKVTAFVAHLRTALPSTEAD